MDPRFAGVMSSPGDPHDDAVPVSDSTQRRCWHSGAGLRLWVMGLFGGLIVGSGISGAHEASGTWWPLVLVDLVMVVAGYFLAFSARLCIDGAELVYRNFVRSHRLPLADVASISPGYFGLLIVTRTGLVRTAVAVQRMNLTAMLRRRGRAARVADEILARAAAARKVDAR
jgi:hypothetical protein